MKDQQFAKLLLIYTYIQLGESNAKMFHQVMTNDEKLEWDFTNHTTDENKKFLYKWKRDNKIRFGDWYVVEPKTKEPRFDNNGCPIIVERKN